MSELIEEFRAQEALNHISDDVMESLDVQGAQNDLDVQEEDF